MSLSLSESIIVGALLKPQAFERFYFMGRTCAIGAALDGSGLLDAALHGIFTGGLTDVAIAHWPILKAEARYPMEDCTTVDSVLRILLFLNDSLRWSRERIASWISQIEQQHAAELV